MGLNKFGAFGKSSKDKARKGVKDYQCYTVTLTQTSTNAPVITVQSNTLNGIPVSAYTSTGLFTLTLVGAFIAGKTILVKLDPAALASVANSFKLVRTSADVITITTYSDTFSSVGNGVLSDTPIEIRVYNN